MLVEVWIKLETPLKRKGELCWWVILGVVLGSLHFSWEKNVFSYQNPIDISLPLYAHEILQILVSLKPNLQLKVHKL